MKISTSILSSDDRIKSVEMLNHTNTSYIHVDVMDGEFVSDKQFYYIGEIKSINTISKYPLDIHMMVNDPTFYLNQFHGMNIEFVTFHVEIGNKKSNDKVIEQIHGLGYKVGLAIKPSTDIKVLEKYLDEIDMILIMSVEPGRGGQEFIHNTVDKIIEVKKLIQGRDILIEVDGGINDKTINDVKDVDIAVVGSYIVKSDNYYKRIEKLFSFNDFDEKLMSYKNKEGSDFIEHDNASKFNYFRFWIIFNLIAVLLYGIYSFIFGNKICFLLGCNMVYGFDAFLVAIFYYFIIAIPFNILLLIFMGVRIFFGKYVFKKVKNFSSVDDKKRYFKIAFMFFLISLIILILFFCRL